MLGYSQYLDVWKYRLDLARVLRPGTRDFRRAKYLGSTLITRNAYELDTPILYLYIS